jgi:hypothetical protein
MHASCTHYYQRKNQAEKIGTSLIPILTVTAEIWAVALMLLSVGLRYPISQSQVLRTIAARSRIALIDTCRIDI